MTLLKHAMLSMYYHRDESNNDANKAVKKATHRVTRSQLDFVDKMYQISFHCEHLGRYFRGNKRRLTWYVVLLVISELLWFVCGEKSRV